MVEGDGGDGDFFFVAMVVRIVGGRSSKIMDDDELSVIDGKRQGGSATKLTLPILLGGIFFWGLLSYLPKKNNRNLIKGIGLAYP